MNEARGLEVSLSWIFAEDHAIDAAQERIAVNLRSRERSIGGLDALLRFLDAVARIRMRGLPLRSAARTRSARQPLKRFEHLRHFRRLIAFIRHVAEAECIGLRLIVATEFEKQQTEPLRRGLAKLLQFRLEHHGANQTDLQNLLLRHLAHGMFGGDMSRLVTEH